MNSNKSKHVNVMLFKHVNVWKMIIYLFTFEALQHIVCIIVYIVV